MLNTTTSLNQQIEILAAQLQGKLIHPGHPDYDEARQIWNGMIDKHPALIVQCAHEQDVITAVSFAKSHDLTLSVRGGGHNVAGHATNDGGLVIDLAPLNQVIVDPEARTVRVGGGSRLGDLDRETQKYGLAVPAGVVSDTGVAGLTLGGGLGYMRNKYGLTCDNLISAKVVTADGQFLTASETENNDLFWGLRGGGGNFGIVTEFEFQAYPLGPEVQFTAVFHDGARMKEALQFYRDFSAAVPDEISSIAVCGKFPPDPEVFPAELHFKPFVLFVAMHTGSAADGDHAMQPMRDFMPPLLDWSGPMKYTEVQTFFDEDYPSGEMRYYWKSLNLTHLTDEAIERIVEHALRQPSDHSTTDLWHIGGAITRVQDDDMAFHGRHASFLLNPEANWEHPEDDDANISWARNFLADMQAFSDGSRYLNFPGFQEEGDDMMRQAFAGKYDKLVALKKKFDPENVFKRNQNIKPE